MKKRVLCMILVGMSVSCLLGGCKKKETIEPIETQQTETVAETETIELETETETEVIPEGMAKSYLTGEWIDEELATKRPIAIMVENTSVTLPQYNISNADIIYESAVEGGITRLMAIFQDYSNMERIGNVRSCRLYYVYFAKEFDAIYMHAGQSAYAKEVLQSDFIDNINGIEGIGDISYYRTSDRKAPHNLYTSSEGIATAIEKLGYSTQLNDSYTGHYQFAKDNEPVNLENGNDAAVVSLYYLNNHPWFEYNEEDGLYYRYEFGDKQVDGINDEQLAVKNIILQNCNSYILDENSGTLNIDYMSGGAGMYITNGKEIPVTWTRESESSPTKYFDENGNEITLNQGKTWVCIVQSEYSDRNAIYPTKDEFNK